ncbi:dTDP-4-amino-4,6-dideoxygalactose transaminase [Desulfomicrobium norvegicum]|uniref:dTDP-4-amino-4,6-dideoxygalactose transaminase n=1 Tax=Desulfomicrobium norvegicum (strain DSM 1741 / NCIMB 8310) TaxID=52561 RepID=A0A8G2C596_DESNO|nr:DegT/DnrJ/EryC1/StrS family aminotransferase [Desulfomicrobium norvegicum]SFM08191.1 dTDP-4-amino-4,6-dideoxygalactose transaminase [Desulfomicrobium norvegicum]
MIPIAKPYLGKAEADAAAAAVLSGWITQGPRVAEFETAFARSVGASHAVAVSSCTTALHLALLAYRVGVGDVVVVPSHSFVATANAVRYAGAEPIFVDVSAEDGNLCPKTLTALIEACREPSGFFFDPAKPMPAGVAWPASLRAGSRPRRLVGVIAVHQVGFACRLQEIMPLCRENGLFVVEDAACAAGSLADYEAAGEHTPLGAPYADMACFSFHPRKVITCGEGGMITTGDDKLATFLRLARQHGMDVPDTARHEAKTFVTEQYIGLGYNYRMTDIQAAVGLVQLTRLPGIVNERRRLAGRYEDGLAGHPWLAVVKEGDWRKVNHQSFRVRLTQDAPLSQKALIERLLARGIATKPGIMNAHQEPAYLPVEGSLPHSETWRNQSILIPLFSELTDAQQDRVVTTLWELTRA